MKRSLWRSLRKAVAPGSGGEHNVTIGQQGQQLGRKNKSETANRKDNEMRKDILEPVRTDWNLHLSFSSPILNGVRNLQEGTVLATQPCRSLVRNSEKLKEKLWLNLEARPKANSGSQPANDFCKLQWYQVPYLLSIRITLLPTWKSHANCYCGQPTLTWNHREKETLGNVVAPSLIDPAQTFTISQ